MKSWRRRTFFGLAMVLPGVLLLMITLGAQARLTPSAQPFASSSGGFADLGIISHTDSPDPVVGTNTVQYVIVVKNFGPDATTNVNLDITQSSFSSSSATFHAATTSSGDIVDVRGTGWTCSITDPNDATCSIAALASGETAPRVTVLVVAPDFDTTITNTATVSSDSTIDDNPDNDTSSEDTTVVVDSQCPPSQVSCGTGHIDYFRDSTVTTGSVPTVTEWLVGTMFFRGRPGATGGQTWSMFAPSKSKCIAVQCTFAMVLDTIPNPYHRGDVTLTLVCHVSHCKKGLVPGGLGLVLLKFDALGIPHVIPRCIPGVTLLCFKTSRSLSGDLVVLVKNLSAGDPRLAGFCIGGGC